MEIDLSHTYAQPGTYVVKHSYFERDSVHGIHFNSVLFTDTIVVSATMPPADCEASFAIDTNSSNNIAVIYNTSKPSLHDSAFTISYYWDFGDGDTSSIALPTHTYDSLGTYEVCLTINTIDSLGFTCSSTFCDSLGFDANGNFLYKNAGFTLQVMDGSMSESENILQEFQFYPNPVNDVLYIEASRLSGKIVQYTLTDLKGSFLMDGNLNGDNHSIDLSQLKTGMYILHLKAENNQENFKIIKK